MDDVNGVEQGLELEREYERRFASRQDYRWRVWTLLTGVFARKAFNGVADGLLFGHPAQLGIQAIAVAASIVYSGVLTFLLLKMIGAIIPLRVHADDETVGLDVAQHGEEAYVHAEG